MSDWMTGTYIRQWDERRHRARPWRPATNPVLVVAPHPDDETLGVGGLVHQLVADGVAVTVMAVTDGDAAYCPTGDARLGSLRAQEQRAGLDRLGGGDVELRRLGLPDGGVAAHEDALVDAICAFATAGPAVTIVAPHHLDAHPDHEAVGRAAARAASRSGAALVSYLFWAWHRRRPEEIPGELVAYALAPETRRRKAAALDCHRTQIEPWEGHDAVLDAVALESARWDHEYFVVGSPETS
jgi:LmbE family N-acetylglucosaminyl deacetylase